MYNRYEFSLAKVRKHRIISPIIFRKEFLVRKN